MEQQLDLSYLQENFGEDEAFLKEMLNTIAAELPTRMDALSQAIDRNEPQAAREAAHSMKSPLEMLGLQDLLEKIKTIEDAGKNEENMSHYKDLMMQANAQFEKVQAEINNLL